MNCTGITFTVIGTKSEPTLIWKENNYADDSAILQGKELDEAYELLQKNRMNQIIAGMLWLRMQERTIPVAIDLCDLHLDMIEEDEDSFTIGAMTSLRALEPIEVLQEAFGSLLTDALKDIVGVQFRNTATLGGSLYSRFAFLMYYAHCFVWMQR